MNVAAFFDMDRTILRCNSGSEWIRFLRARGELGSWESLRAFAWVLQYKLALLDLERVTAKVVAAMAGDSEGEMIAKCEEFFDGWIRQEVTPQARVAIERHRDAGHVLAILTSSTQYVATRVAEDLEIEHVICTRLVAQDGAFTGEYQRPACYGDGKIVWAEQFAAQAGIDLAASYFYTDSFTDLPMLERVGERRIVNPDARLLRHARRAGWPIEHWR